VVKLKTARDTAHTQDGKTLILNDKPHSIHYLLKSHNYLTISRQPQKLVE